MEKNKNSELGNSLVVWGGTITVFILLAPVNIFVAFCVAVLTFFGSIEWAVYWKMRDARKKKNG